VNIDAEAYRRLIDIGLALSAEKHIDSLLERILVEAKTLANADAGTLYLVTPESNLTFAIVLNDTLKIAQGGRNGDPIALPEVNLKNPDGALNMSSIATRSANLSKTILIEDLQQESGTDCVSSKMFDDLTGYESRSFLTVPLRNSSDTTIGVLQLLNAKDSDGEIISFPRDVVPLIEALSSQASVSLENRHLLDEQAELRRQLEHEVDERTEQLKNALSKLSEAHIILKDLTTIDAVTRIRNRQYFDQVYEQEWRRAVRQKIPISLLMVDIDHFKQVNDEYGHLAGDESLSVVARCIDRLFNRPSDVVARYGGEEFVVILPYVKDDNALQMAEQVRQYVEKLPISADGHQIYVTISIGYVTEIPTTEMSSRDLIAKADKALYSAKAQGRNRVVRWSEL
jgi:diguanylate cyclase (GGDEF)-like protein